MSEPSELTKRIKKLLGGELFRFSWEIPGPHTPGRPGKDRPKEKPVNEERETP